MIFDYPSIHSAAVIQSLARRLLRRIGNLAEIIADGVQQFKASRTQHNANLAHDKIDGSQFGFAYVADHDGSRHALRASALEVRITEDAAANFTILNIQEVNAYV